MATDPLFIGTARTATLKLVNATGTTTQTLLTMGASGGLVEGLFVTSNDTTARLLTLLLSNGDNAVLVDSVRIPVATTTRPVQQVNLLDPNRWTWLDLANIKWALAAGRILQVRMETAVTAGAYETSVVCNYGEF